MVSFNECDNKANFHWKQLFRINRMKMTLEEPELENLLKIISYHDQAVTENNKGKREHMNDKQCFDVLQ